MAARVVDAGISAELMKKSAFTKPIRSITFSNCSKTILSCSYSHSNLNLQCQRPQFFYQTWNISTSVNCRDTRGVKALKSGNKKKDSSNFGSKEVSSNGGAGFSLGLEEDEGREICLGCGVFMQDKDREAPGFFIRPVKKTALEDLEEQNGEQILETLEEEEADMQDEVEITETVYKEEILEREMKEEGDLDLEEEEWRKRLDGFAPAGPGYGRISDEILELRRKERNLEKEKKKKVKGGETLMDDILVCARCYALRYYGNVKDTKAENLLPEFNFEAALGGRIMKSIGIGRSGRTVVVMVVDAVDFDGSFPRQAAMMINNALDQGNPKAISVILAATKCDLLPSQISPTRLDKWVRSRAKVLGAPKLNKVFLVSAHKDWGIRNFIYHVRDLAGPRGNVWFIGAQNAGKSTLVNAIGKKEGRKVTHLTEAAVPGTTLGILRIGGILPANAKLYDTPGLLHPYEITMRLNREEQKMIEIRKELKPRTYRVKVGQAVHVGGLMRLDVNQASVETIYVTVWASIHVSLHLGKVDNANEIKEKHFGTKLQPPIGDERVPELGQWRETEIKVSGKSWDVNSIDIAVAGLGWISLGLKGEASLSVWTYDGVYITVREPLVLDRAHRFERPGFSLSTVVSKATSKRSKKDSNDSSEMKNVKSRTEMVS